MGSSVPSPDMGIDLSIHDIVVVGKQRIESGFRIDVQARSTTQVRQGKADIRYDLDVATYETLRYPAAGCPRLLVVLLLPEEENDWLAQSEQELILRHAAYWISLKGQKVTSNRRSVRLTIPQANLFTVQTVQAMMSRIKAGEEP
jgi:hypothetical protein